MPRKNKPPLPPSSSDFPPEEDTSPETPKAISDSQPPTEDEEWVLFRGLGHKPDEPDERDYPVAGVRGDDGSWSVRPVGGLMPPGSTTPDNVRLDTAPARDQGGASACVGFGYACHINARLAFVLKRDPTACVWPSEQGIYGVARRNDPKDEEGNFLLDDGCYPREGALGMMLHGVVDEKRFMFDESNINSALPWDVLTAGYDAKILKFHRVLTPDLRAAAEFLDELERLCASGFTVPFAQDVDRPFNDYTSGVLGPITGTTRGSHYTVIKGYERKRRVFRCQNSWGLGYGISGEYEMSYDRVLTKCRDFIVLTTIPDQRNIR